VLVVGWSGLRGAVTLAAALSIPLALPGGAPFPGRALVIFLASSVILATLLLQGLTLPHLICRLGVQDDGRQVEEERAARLELARAGLAPLRAPLERSAAEAPELEAAAQVAAELEERVERLAAEACEASPAGARRRAERAVRARTLAAQRDRLVALYHEGRINDEVLRRLQTELDAEEARLTAI
jgi:CPA1 family monovalent cation:H+ antiporter